MEKLRRVKFKCGELSLEGVLSTPEGAGPFPAVVVCHPHPLYGGSMDNNVVNSVFDILASALFVTLKFNFRGVGDSDGGYSEGVGEQEDVAAAVTYISSLKEVDPNRVGLAGYSAGAGYSVSVACKDSRVKALASISPPLSNPGFELLKSCPKPKLLIAGGMDAYIEKDRFIEFCRSLPEPRECYLLEQADHFWWGQEVDLAAKVAEFFSENLK